MVANRGIVKSLSSSADPFTPYQQWGEMMCKFKVYGFDESGACPLILGVESFGGVLDYIKMELNEFGNLFKIRRFDVIGYNGLVLRRNVQ
jgi:hypothetical protein